MVLAAWILSPGLAAGGTVEIEVVTPDHAVSDGRPELPHVEPHVAVHPDDPARLLAGAIVTAAERPGPWHCAAFLSRDGGASWGRHDFEMERCIDPWVLFTRDGAALFFAIEIRRDGEAEERFRLVLYRSQDGGLTWPERPLDLGRAHDHQIVVADRAEPETLYLVSRRTRRTAAGRPRHAVYLAASRDGGRDFQDLAEVRPSNLAQNPTGLALLSDGSLVVTLLDFQRDVDGFDQLGLLERPRAWALRSVDGGRTFSELLLVTEACGMGGDGFPGYPFLAADHADRLVHACIRPGFEGVAVVRSSDRGESWSEPVRPDADPVDGPAHARTPMLAAGSGGVIAAAWYDRRHDPERRCQDVYFAASLDGGETFTEPVRVSTETSCPDAPGNGVAGTSWPSGGDYSSLTAGADGRFHLLWADSRSGVFQLRHATLEVRDKDSSP